MRIATPFIVSLFLAGTANAAILSDNGIVGDTTNTFEGLSLGNVAGTIAQTGATYGESFVGQTVSSVDVDIYTFDALTGAPTAPLTLATAASAPDNIGVTRSAGSNVIYGDRGGQVGDGALSILLDTATDVFGFDIVGTDVGNFTVDFFGAAGNLLGSVTQASANGFFGFRSTSTDIFGVSITNDDLAGLGYDNVTFNTVDAPIPLPAGLPLLLAGLGGLALLRRAA